MRVRAGGIVLAMVGAASAIFSFPFVTWVGFAGFPLGVGSIVWGVRLAVKGPDVSGQA